MADHVFWCCHGDKVMPPFVFTSFQDGVTYSPDQPLTHQVTSVSPWGFRVQGRHQDWALPSSREWLNTRQMFLTAQKYERRVWNMQTNRYGWVNKYFSLKRSDTSVGTGWRQPPPSLFAEGFEVEVSGDAPQRFLRKTPVWNQIPFFLPASRSLRSKDMCVKHAATWRVRRTESPTCCTTCTLFLVELHFVYYRPV